MLFEEVDYDSLKKGQSVFLVGWDRPRLWNGVEYVYPEEEFVCEWGRVMKVLKTKVKVETCEHNREVRKKVEGGVKCYKNTQHTIDYAFAFRVHLTLKDVLETHLKYKIFSYEFDPKRVSIGELRCILYEYRKLLYHIESSWVLEKGEKIG
jgi:hypothetical protein